MGKVRFECFFLSRDSIGVSVWGRVGTMVEVVRNAIKTVPRVRW